MMILFAAQSISIKKRVKAIINPANSLVSSRIIGPVLVVIIRLLIIHYPSQS
jgi:hypothetical protein